MKAQTGRFLEDCRLPGSERADKFNGAFRIPHPWEEHINLCVICSDGGDWEHVSVTLAPTELVHQEKARRTPTWEEMAWIKNLFWESHEAVMQLHPPEYDYVNCHKYCLHLWKPCNQLIPLPPAWMVGPLKGQTLPAGLPTPSSPLVG
jgi:hypothetical protein